MTLTSRPFVRLPTPVTLRPCPAARGRGLSRTTGRARPRPAPRAAPPAPAAAAATAATAAAGAATAATVAAGAAAGAAAKAGAGARAGADPAVTTATTAAAATTARGSEPSVVGLRRASLDQRGGTHVIGCCRPCLCLEKVVEQVGVTHNGATVSSGRAQRTTSRSALSLHKATKTNEFIGGKKIPLCKYIYLF